MDGMSGDAREDVGQPGLRVYSIHLGRYDQAIHGRGALSAAVRSAEQPCFSPKGYTSQSSFGGVVREAHAPILKEQGEARPSLQNVVERFGQVMPTREVDDLLPHVGMKILDQRPAQLLPNGQTILGALAIDRSLDLKQRVDPMDDLDGDRR